MRSVEVKICGIKTADVLQAALEAGADYIGLMFYKPSPRYISVDQALELVQSYPDAKYVAVMVNPGDREIVEIMAAFHPAYFQLHGDETPARIEEIRTLTGASIIKAVGIRDASDVAHAKEYDTVADMLLLDTKIPKSELRGGTGVTFDWKLLEGVSFDVPWILSGGLNAQNVQQAIGATNAVRVDVSSGVESSKGTKDAALIRAFIQKAKTCSE